MNFEREDRIKGLLAKGVNNGVFPGAVLIAANGGKLISFQAVGKRSLFFRSGSMKEDTIFDLASLTKPLATTLALMKCVDDGKIDLDQPLESLLVETIPEDKKSLTPRLIMSHCAGFSDWEPFYLKLVDYQLEKRKGLLRKWIMETPLVYKPGTETIYSDLGFMILEWIIEQCTRSPLPVFLDRNFFFPLSMKRTYFYDCVFPVRFEEDQFAATEECPWRKKLSLGFVHDENAYALGGYSGHAGLFGTAEEVYIITDLLRSHFLGERQDYLRPETVRAFFTLQNIVKGSTWALGWDTPSPGKSSSGKHFSVNSVGHLGYTGTSVWMDLEKNVIVILLTNRIHPTRKNEKIRAFRPVLHDMIMEEVFFDGRD
ncbi:MAG: serine hydrolase [Deltaproteobacteria bacterium]|nr:serine hydrolase [Deltaproteobacteria bacterium]